MRNPVTISLVAPIYGVERYIGRFAESVLGQSYPHIQFVFVNDGTKDSSIQILEGIINGKFPHLRDRIVIVDKENGGLPAARKTGMEYVTGDYVWHIDSDDWLELDAVSKIAARIDETDSDIVYFGFYKEYADKTKPKRENVYSAAERSLYIRNMYNHRAYGCVWNKCVRRTLYDNGLVNFPKYSYAEDTYLMSQLVGYASSLSYLDECLYHYRKDNPQSITRQNRKRRKREYARNFLDLYNIYRDVPADVNPVSVLYDDILLQAGWYSIAYSMDLFKEYPSLADDILDARVRSGGDVWVPFLIIAKLVAFFKKQ
jgi:glycosyltransferase involved in cell wall biosynthesis